MEKTFILPGVTESQNVIDRLHWSQKHKERDHWYYSVLAVAGRKSPKEGRRMHVEIVRVSKRLLDPQNCYSGIKWMLDAFVFYGHLRGDADKDISLTMRQEKCKTGEQPNMRVTITPDDR